VAIEQKRVYADRAGRTTLLVAAAPGVARVAVSGDLVGEVGLVSRGAARDVAAGPAVAAATPEDAVLDFEPTGFGPAAAVGFHDGALVAAAPGGRVARREEGAWAELGSVSAPAGIAGDLLAAGDGLYRLPGLDRLLAADCRDAVPTPEGPLAATAEGLRLAGERVLDGSFVAAAAREGRLLASTGEHTWRHDGDEWTPRPTAEPVVALAVGPAAYAVSRSGTLFADAGDGWRSRALGLPETAALVVASIRE
jgi:hypothetical protein